jgi:hypothetical protein
MDSLPQGHSAKSIMPSEAQIREAKPPLPCTGRHFTVQEVAELWRLSDDLVRRLFEAEPGVITIGETRSSGRRRRYVTLRIPEMVLERVHSRLQGNTR